MKLKNKLTAFFAWIFCMCSLLLMPITSYAAEDASQASGASSGFFLLAGGLIVIIAVVVVVSAVSSVIGAVAGEVEDEED